MPQPFSSSLLLTVPGSRQCTAGGGDPSRCASSTVIIMTASCERVNGFTDGNRWQCNVTLTCLAQVSGISCKTR